MAFGRPGRERQAAPSWPELSSLWSATCARRRHTPQVVVWLLRRSPLSLSRLVTHHSFSSTKSHSISEFDNVLWSEDVSFSHKKSYVFSFLEKPHSVAKDDSKTPYLPSHPSLLPSFYVLNVMHGFSGSIVNFFRQSCARGAVSVMCWSVEMEWNLFKWKAAVEMVKCLQLQSSNL